MLFSEPKIPQLDVFIPIFERVPLFQCSSASRKFLNSVERRDDRNRRDRAFQCSSASRKFLNLLERNVVNLLLLRFSALQRAENSSMELMLTAFQVPMSRFSALQRAENSSMCRLQRARAVPQGFSALQRAENSSIGALAAATVIILTCFSALQRAENSSIANAGGASRRRRSFSALQRAENSSMLIRQPERGLFVKFQCSSASRKFLNDASQQHLLFYFYSFSALQRAENSSIGEIVRSNEAAVIGFSALQRAENSSIQAGRLRISWCASVSVLFSEPKIPQSKTPDLGDFCGFGFSALQRAENSSMPPSVQQ